MFPLSGHKVAIETESRAQNFKALVVSKDAGLGLEPKRSDKPKPYKP